MRLLVNDRWEGQFTLNSIGRHEFQVVAWIDRFATWVHQLEKRLAAGQDVRVDLQIGAALVGEAARNASGADAAVLHVAEAALIAGDVDTAFAAEIHSLMAVHLPRRFATESEIYPITVERERARFSAWYELFPRSAADEPGRHGTFRDVIKRLPYIAELGFDVLYLPPIHPIGYTFRKGKNNSLNAGPNDPGSPWAIGNADGGHMSIHPELGTLDDFRALVREAQKYGIEVALDIAFQCSPDHPYVREHPEWFRARPDGTIQYAENPPKKYQDIYPFDFESEDWQGLWQELRRVFEFWIEQGVRIFRVDNPHTKSFRFWDWCLNSLKSAHPDLIFLSEAFTRPKVMYHLAKIGFTQSYTYYTWRTTKHELTSYLQELNTRPVSDFFIPNFWPNTPDILTPQFYAGQRSVFMTRAAMAATLTASWGMYGPVYELMEHTPVAGREEYINNEKYEIRHWNLDAPHSLRGYIGQLNRIRREHPALHRNDTLRFHRVDIDFHEHEWLLAYSKTSPDGSDIILVVVNLDPERTHSGWVQVPLNDWNVNGVFQAHDLLTDARYTWSGEYNYVQLSPMAPVHIFCIRRLRRDERGFEYFA
ncbi:MAG: alpha-1,4-glucan:maltose-1-phosphate maltosyltransferase [Chloroflexus sp.]|nr:MAG: alpha-1,4-glucan:maltose-1-phosphate maltosyltransferase [Chloroflexus sp.]